MNRTIAVRRLAMAATLACQSLIFPLGAAGPLGPADPGAALIGYNPANGHVFISANGVIQWRVDEPQLNPAQATLPLGQNAEPLGGATLIGQSARGPFSFVDVNLGPIGSPSLAPGELMGFANAAINATQFQTSAVIPTLADSPPYSTGPVEPGKMKVLYDPASRDVIVSVNSVLSWYVEAIVQGVGQLTGSSPSFPPTPPEVVVLVSDNPSRVGHSTFSTDPSLIFTDHDLGPVLPVGLNLASVQLQYSSPSTGQLTTINAIAVPEPATAALFAAATLAALQGTRRP